ncbi:MAG TPA: glycosyltransferase family 4 protein [Tepidisphaeraceae bacterium]|jgi:glycosyltransferase involved in cell wall biosynthesis
MRLLMTTDTVGGVWSYSLELARALEPQGVQIALATMGAPLSQAQRKQVNSLRNVSLFESTYKLEWMEDPWQDVERSGAWLRDIQEMCSPHIVHLNGYAHGRFDFGVPKLVVAHSCVLSWWEAVKGEAAPSKWNHYRDEVSEGLKGSDMVVAPSHAMLSALMKHYGPLPRTKVIYNGRSGENYRRGEKQEMIFTAGRIWDEAKNISALEQIAPGLSSPVYVAGDDTNPNGKSATQFALNKLGMLDDAGMTAWLSRAGIYCLPARYEPFGLSILEAALSGCALVLGDIDSLREIWADTAVYVDPDDTFGLSTALEKLTQSPARRTELGLRAYARALRYSTTAMADSYLAVYRDLLRTANAPAYLQEIHPTYVPSAYAYRG